MRIRSRGATCGPCVVAFALLFAAPAERAVDDPTSYQALGWTADGQAFVHAYVTSEAEEEDAVLDAFLVRSSVSSRSSRRGATS